jgi:circadian clock protein KaiC
MTNDAVTRVSTGLDWLDRLLGGGLPSQSLVVVAGLPGSGKSVLTFHIMAEAVRQGATTMLVTTTHQPPSKLGVQYGNLSFLRQTGVLDKMEFLELDTGVQEQTLLNLLNTIVLRIQERKVGVVVVDSFRAISDLAQSPSQIWRFLGSLSKQLVENDCIGILVGEYSFPRDLDTPEVSMADVAIYLEVERQPSAETRTLRVYKVRGGPYLEGRHAFYVTDDGIQFAASQRDQTR